jgi:quercetin dioxygenase-like cupin family protein
MPDTAHVIDPRTAPSTEFMGRTLAYLTETDGPCVIRGTMPPGADVPLHSHGDPETFLVLSGEFEALAGSTWVRVQPGQILHVPPDAKHALRNTSSETAEMLMVTTAKMVSFFKEIAAAPEDFLEIAERYGYWNA